MSNFTISILGKPNVGKSTLFNRLIGKKKSIVSPIEGITRDRIYGTFQWLDKEYNLIDTGGYIPNSKLILEQLINAQAEIAKNTSELIIFMVDGISEITVSDRVLAQIIKESGKLYQLVINKIDNKKDENKIYAFYELGLNNPICISAESGRQVGLLLDKINEINFEANKISNKDFISLAVIGMPNVGKSSLVNSILKENKTIVSDIAGTTRDSIDSYVKYYNKDFRIIDTAGLRKKSKIDDSIEFYSTLRSTKSIDECDIAAVLVDVDKGFHNQDKNIIKYVISRNKGLILVLNKWDLIDKETNTMKLLKEDIIYEYPILQFYPILFISVKNNLRIGQILQNTLKIYNSMNKKISTKELNDFLLMTMNKYPPPSVKGKEIKMKYISQVHKNPPVIAIFSNQPDLIPESYKRYIMNQLRNNFNFSGATLKISYRKK